MDSILDFEGVCICMKKDRRMYLVEKLLQKAGDNPSTPEEKEAYKKAKQLMKEINMTEKEKYGGYIGHKESLKEILLGKFINAKNVFKDIIFKNSTVTIPWDKFYKRELDDSVIYEITPSNSVRNNQTYILTKIMASFYKKPSELRNWFSNGSLLSTKSPYRCNFRIVMKAKSISFYLILPREKANELIRKVESVYNDSKITIKEVKALPKLYPEKVFCTELGYRKHDIFSLDTDKSNNFPLPSLLTSVRNLEGDDIAIFDAMFEPYDKYKWYKEAKEAHTQLEKGQVPNVKMGTKFFGGINKGLEKIRNEIVEATRFTKDQKKVFEEWKKDTSTYREAIFIRQEMTNATKRKQNEEVLKTYLRIAVQSEDKDRAKDTAITIANSFKDISGNNELDRFDVPEKWNSYYLNAIETRKGFSIRFKPNKFSIDEAGKFVQLPGDTLIKEFPEIQARTTKEVTIPEELTQKNIKTVRYGYVTERGVRKLVGIPLEAYSVKGINGELIKAELKAVYDAVMSSTFGQGKQGTGKSEGFGTVWAYDMVKAGFTVILMDTADGEVLKNFVNSLPADFPEEKIHCLNFDYRQWSIPLGWDDVYGRTFNSADGDEELQALEISERITSRFISFINSLSNTGEFTDKMGQFVNSCMRAITFRKGWSFLDLELALTSPSFREELLELDAIRKEPDIVRDLEQLQKMALEGKTNTTIDGIVSRLKVLSSSKFMANLFYQPPKFNEDGTPLFDMRKLMDNQEGGYGHVICIYASEIWDEHQATILGFMEDKINFNAFSRVDIPQSERKPVLKWIDEPHKVIKRLENKIAGTAVEFRKYRVKYLFTGHSIDQMGKAAKSLMDGGVQITSYKTESVEDLKRFKNQFAPYSDPDELYSSLPEKHVAINKIRLPSGENCPAFIAEMVKPPDFVKDRSHVWQQSAEKYGRHWKDVIKMIQDKRMKYYELDIEWHKKQEEEIALEKVAKKELEKELKKAKEPKEKKTSTKKKGTKTTETEATGS
jgi:hypothetical protein